MAKEQRIIIFEGDVQGVGFRYTATHLAQNYDIAGYVRNLSDGNVEVVAEGETAEIDSFLAVLGERFSGYIRNCRQSTARFKSSFHSFTVQR